MMNLRPHFPHASKLLRRYLGPRPVRALAWSTARISALASWIDCCRRFTRSHSWSSMIPQRLKKLPLGNEVWDYEFLAGNSRCVGYRVYFDEGRRSQRWERMACR
jgi:hypothetical protein